MKGTIFDLTGRSALVTGGSKGLGRAMARGFAQAGADIAICSRHEDELRRAAGEIVEGTEAQCHHLVADMSRRGEADRLAEWALEAMGKVDILVNNAGANRPQAIDAITDQVWDQIVELNLTSCMALSRALLPQMRERKWGRVIHISSIMGLGSKAERDSYSATKFALHGLAKASALDVGADNITVNCIAPGPFSTDMPGLLLTDEQKQTFAEGTALGRWGQPDELVGPALLLASEAGSYITGEVLVVDGGVVSKIF